MVKRLLTPLLCSLVFCSGCGFNATPLLVGSAGGAAAGAGTGAIIGSVISSGNVANSALLGTAIGLPVGLAAAMIYDYNSESTLRQIKIDDIKSNQREIMARQREIDALRDDVAEGLPQGNPSVERREYRFMGESLGNPYR